MGVVVLLAAVVAFLLYLLRQDRLIRRLFQKWDFTIQTGKLAAPEKKTSWTHLHPFQLIFNQLRDRFLYQKSFIQYLSRYVDPAVVDSAASHNFKVPPHKRRVSILHIDIENFTSYTARNDVEEVSSMISEFWSLVERAVHRYGGIVDKHMGDAVVAMWNALEPQKDAPRQAVNCLLLIERAIRFWSLRRIREKLDPIAVWGSVATGPCIVGHIGKERIEFTALGNPMNVASRIVQLAQKRGARRIMDRYTYECVRNTVQGRELGEVSVRGIPAPLRLYEIEGAKKPQEVQKSKRTMATWFSSSFDEYQPRIPSRRIKHLH